MVLLLELLLLYVFGVFLYTIVVKNDAMHKFSPFTNVKEIVKEGMVGIGVGFAVVGVLYFVIGQIITFIVI